MYSFILSTALLQAGLGTGRTIPTVAAAAGLAGVILGALALARRGLRSLGGAIGSFLALIGLTVGGLHAYFAAGAVGTGNGLAGAVVAVALGLVGVILGAIALTRSR